MKIVRIEKVGSTNEYAFDLINKGEAQSGTVIWADEQTAGRGQGDHSWLSRKGLNLTFSIMIKPDFIKPGQQFLLSEAVALGLCDYAGLFSSSVSIKWPNDIYIGSKKLCGILFENTWLGQRMEWAIIGIGFNLNETEFDPALPNPVSLQMLTGIAFKPEEVMNLLLSSINVRFIQLESGLAAQIESEYKEKLFGSGRQLEFCGPQGNFNGIIKNITPEGYLLVERTDGKVVECRHPEYRLMTMKL